MNFKACVFAAALLLSGNVVSANVSVELVKVEAPVILEDHNQRIDAAILAILVEEHATELFSISVEDAWSSYNSGTLVITELQTGEEYSLVMDGITEILIMDNAN